MAVANANISKACGAGRFFCGFGVANRGSQKFHGKQYLYSVEGASYPTKDGVKLEGEAALRPAHAAYGNPLTL